MQKKLICRRALVIVLHVLAGLSLGLCLATQAISYIGGWHDPQFHQLARQWELLTDGGYDGRIQIILVHRWDQPLTQPADEELDAWLGRYRNFDWESGRFRVQLWAQMSGSTEQPLMLSGRRLDINAPFWFASVICLILPALMWLVLPIRRRHTPTVPTRPQSSVPLETDLECVHCGYNLRTLGADKLCPECGAAVADSRVERDNLSQAPRQWLRHLRIGCIVLFFSRLALIATYACVFKRNGGFVLEYRSALISAVTTIALYVIGVLLITRFEHPFDQAPRRRIASSLRKVTIVSLAILTMGVIWQMVSTVQTRTPFGLMGAPSVVWDQFAVPLMQFGWALFSATIALEFTLHARRARRLPSEYLARHAMLAGAFGATTNGLMVFAAGSIVEQWTEPGLWWIVIVAWFIGVIWNALLNLELAARIRACSRPTNASAPVAPIEAVA